MELFQSAAMFILAHEVSHIALGHLPRNDDALQDDVWSRETEADVLGAYATLVATTRTFADPQVVALGCALAPLAWHAVELGVHYLDVGNTEVPLRPSHPPGPLRANVIVNAIAMGESITSVDDDGADFRRKLNQAIELAQNLVNECVIGFKAARRSSVPPSPVWRLGAPVNVIKEDG
jgi:hypothetical protein